MINNDYHIHTNNSCDGASMPYEVLIKKAKEKGIKDYGVTDHIHTPYNFPDIIKSHQAFLKNKVPGMHFGVEVSSVTTWELNKISKGDYEGNITYGIREGGPKETNLAIAIDEVFIKKYDIEFVVGGTHWLMYQEYTRENLIKDYHRQNMFLATHPLVNIVAHPWWYMGPYKNKENQYATLPWFDDFTVIPNSIHKEFANALIENNSYHEINLGAIVLSPAYTEKFKVQYLDYLFYMKSLGVKFSIGSDCHNATYDINFKKANEMLDEFSITSDFSLL